MKTLLKNLKSLVLATGIALSVMFGSTQQSKAAFYDNYYTLYSNYLSGSPLFSVDNLAG
jgi:hypothetical protein